MGRSREQDQLVRQLVESVRYEVLPTRAVAEELHEHVPVGRTVTVTASPRAGLEETLALSVCLAEGGYDVVPHLAARMVRGRSELKEVVDRLATAGIRRIFVPGGDATPTEQTYQCALELLQDLRDLGHPFDEIGITGYPESHPAIDDDVTVQSMWDKRHYATHVVSNLCPSADTVVSWLHRLRRRGMLLPVYVGVPGPVERTKLVAMASRIGVSQSARFLAGHRFLFARLAAPGGFRPERFLHDLAPGLQWSEAGVAGIHLYTFNQVARAERWRREMSARLGDLAG